MEKTIYKMDVTLENRIIGDLPKYKSPVQYILDSFNDLTKNLNRNLSPRIDPKIMKEPDIYEIDKNVMKISIEKKGITKTYKIYIDDVQVGYPHKSNIKDINLGDKNLEDLLYPQDARIEGDMYSAPVFARLNMIDNVDELNIQERIPVLGNGNQYFSSDYVDNNNMFTPINIDLKDFPFNIRLDSDNSKVYKGNLELFNTINPDVHIQIHSITLEFTVLTNVKTLNN